MRDAEAREEQEANVRRQVKELTDEVSRYKLSDTKYKNELEEIANSLNSESQEASRIRSKIEELKQQIESLKRSGEESQVAI